MQDLSIFFNPKSVALIGATSRRGSVGLGLAKNLLATSSEAGEGREGRRIFFVNPRKKNVLGEAVYKAIKEIPGKIDLAIIAVPSIVVLEAVQECLEKGVEGAIIIASGFAESGDEGKERQKQLAELFQKSGVPFLGPNCLGIVSPVNNFNGSFAPAMPAEGDIAFVSQSGALIDALIDYSSAEQYGFSSLVSYGNEAGLTINDFLDYFSTDEKTKVIALYLESIQNGQQFIELAKKAARSKQVVVLKGGVTELGSQAALSHTAALAGNSQVYSAAFAKAGIFEARNLQELIDVSLALSLQPRFHGGVGVLSNAGALAVLAADACDRYGLRLPTLGPSTIEKLKQSGQMNPAMNFKNPLDILGDGLSARYEAALAALLGQDDIGCCIVILSFQIMTDIGKIAKAIIKQKELFEQKAVICCLAAGKFTGLASRKLKGAGIPAYRTPEAAALAAKSLMLK